MIRGRRIMIKHRPVSDINQINNAIEQLSTIDIKNATIEQLQAYFQQIINGYSVAAINFNPGLLLYRGILFSEKPSLYENIIYPPKDKAKLNRASIEGKQMFYAASSKKTVFYELDVKPGDKLILSRWVTNNNLLFNNVGYTKSNFEELSSSRLPFEYNDPHNNETNELIANYLAKSFCQPISEIDNHLYKRTIAIAKIHLNQVNDNKFSGLFYPTVRLHAEEDNFAIDKETIDKGLLDVEGIEFIEVLDKLENRYKYRIIDIADNIKNGNINWKNLNKHWSVYDDSDELVFVEESGHIIAYNSNGDIINPD